MKTHYDNLKTIISSKTLFKEKNPSSDGIYYVNDQDYKTIYKKLQTRKTYKDSDGDEFCFKGDFIIEKSRPSICIPTSLIDSLYYKGGEDGKVTYGSPASQLCAYLHGDEHNSQWWEQLADYKQTISEFFKVGFEIQIDNGSKEPVNILQMRPFEYMSSENPISLPMFSTQIISSNIYFFHSSFGFIHPTQLTDEMIDAIDPNNEALLKARDLGLHFNEIVQKWELPFKTLLNMSEGKAFENFLDNFEKHTKEMSDKFDEYSESV